MNGGRENPSEMESRYLKKRLNTAKKQRDGTLCDIEDHLSSDSDHSLGRAPLVLTLEDLQQPGLCAPRESATKQSNAMFHRGSESLRMGGDKTGSLRTTEQENKKLRDRLLALQEQNAVLTSQNLSLRNRIESMQLGLAKCKSQSSSRPMRDVRSYGSAFGSRPSRILDLEEHVASLEAESEAQEKALRIAEDKLAENVRKIAEKDQILQKFREEMKKLKVELYESNKSCKRAEKQRNEALLNAEELTRAFQQYKKNVVEKLETVKTEGDLMNKNLQTCVREREELLEKCKNLDNELETNREHLRKIMSETSEEKEKQKSVEMKNLELISLLTQSNQRVLRLESDLENKEKVLTNNVSLLQENKELKEYIAEKVNQNRIKSEDIESHLQKDFSEPIRRNMSENIKESNLENSKSLIAELRAKLSKKEAENQDLQAKLLSTCSSHPLDTEPVKLSLQQSEAEKCQHLESVSKQLQEENDRLTEAVKELKRKLSKAQAETANTKLSMAQRTSQFQLIQEELLEKASKTTKLEQEMIKKTLKITSLQKLLEEKSEAYSCAAARNARLEQELMDFKAHICHLEENISKEHQEVILAFEKSKSLYCEQHNDLLRQTEQLKCELELKNLEVAERELTINSLQEDAASKQLQLESLDNVLVDTRKHRPKTLHQSLVAVVASAAALAQDVQRFRTQEEPSWNMSSRVLELELQRKGAAEEMRELETQLETEAKKVKQLESALALCKEELGSYLQQLEENRERFQSQSKKRSEEVQCLQRDIKLRTQSLQEITEENVRLQQTLQQQQQMLQQATTRIGDLEDTQAELEKQISNLEFDLEKQRSSSRVDLAAAEEKLYVANKDLSCKAHQVHELSDMVSQLKAEMDHCKEKLSQAEIHLMSATADVESKRDKLSQMELMLQRTQVDLSDKSQLVTLLQERVTIAENDLMKKGEMESELENNVRLVEELQETLSKTHLSVEEKDAIIQTLREEIRTCKAEMEEKDHELLDLDQALKDRNWELNQRATQITQLDISIREHKEELQQKITQLESSLKKCEMETKDQKRQISTLDEKLQEARDQLREKDFELLQKEQHVTQLLKESEKTRRTLNEMEQTLREQKKHISEQQREGQDVSQQVRLTAERLQICQLELLEARQQLVEAQKESDRLTRKLEAMDRMSREELQHVKHDLDDAHDTIANLKTELEARNEVIKATNEVLILKESELTRLKAHISGYERSLALKQMPDPSSGSPDVYGDRHALESYKLPKSCDMDWKAPHSISDLSLSDVSSVDFRDKNEDMKNLSDSALGGILSDKGSCAPSDNFNETSFNPLEYNVDHCDKSDSPDLGTLSGMLKYIKEEMKLNHNPNGNQ
ncbi:coiled-coil domain-containing protein 18 isoform X2 [Hyla sarda]|uniref:coiled-coil domain-containing protein 18 isoform X2 n=1 Tax=Hyla sarda TaxID=327740 RepID=UPI0024C37C8C|nr:coiled-coil domain-containing protein 18 isoform X2 [Hyla sarda]